MRTLLLSLLSLATLSISAQQRDERVRDYLPPVRIVWMQGDISGQDNLLEPSDGQSEMSSRHLCRMKSSQGQQPAILLDFGREIHGGIRLVTGMPASQKPVNVRIRLGESVAEAMSEPGGKTNAGNDHAMRDFPMQLPWLGVAEVGNSGFRFVRIDLLDPDAELILREVNACFIYRDLPYLGSFRCSDPRLNQIWNTGAYTVHLNMQNYLWDGIKRDRLVWVGDLHPEVTTVATVFGPHSIVPRSLDLARQTTPLPGWMNDIGSYSLWWILIQRDWYRYYADLDYLNEQKEYLSGLLKQVLSTLDKNGREHLGGGMRFLDWPSNENPDAIDAGLQSLTVMALQAGSELSRLLGDQELAQQCDLAQKKALKEAQKLGRSFLKNPAGPLRRRTAAGRSGSPHPQRCGQFFDLLRILHAGGVGHGRRIPTSHGPARHVLGRDARTGCNDLLGGLRSGLDGKCRPYRQPGPRGKDRRPRPIRGVLLRRLPPQPVPRLGFGTDVVALPARIGLLPGRCGNTGHRTTFGLIGVGRGILPHGQRSGTGPP